VYRDLFPFPLTFILLDAFSKRFNDVYSDFAHPMFMFVDSSKNDHKTHDACQRMQLLYGQLMEIARESLNTDTLERLKVAVGKQSLAKVSESTIESTCKMHEVSSPKGSEHDRAGSPGASIGPH
jgi:hypothetical protein